MTPRLHGGYEELAQRVEKREGELVVEVIVEDGDEVVVEVNVEIDSEFSSS